MTEVILGVKYLKAFEFRLSLHTLAMLEEIMYITFAHILAPDSLFVAQWPELFFKT